MNIDLQKFEPVVIYKKESNLVEKLKKKGIQCIIFGKEEKKNVAKQVIKKEIITQKNSRVRNILSSIKLLIKSLPEALKIIKVIHKFDIEILHLNHNLNGDRAGIIAGILTKKKIISHHRGLYKPVLIDIMLSKYIDKIICISDYVKTEYVQNGIDGKKCLTVYNGVDTSFFKPLENNSEEIVIGCIGRLEHWKGQQVLIEAIPAIIKNFPKAKFQFIGNGSNKANLILLANKFDVKDSIEFVGSVNNVKDYIKDFTIAVHSSVEPEPFGRVLIEAMAMGKVVISTNIGGPKEIIENNVDGYLLEPNQPQVLAEKIIQLLQDKYLRKNIEIKAREKVVNYFDSNKTSLYIQKLYT